MLELQKSRIRIVFLTQRFSFVILSGKISRNSEGEMTKILQSVMGSAAKDLEATLPPA